MIDNNHSIEVSIDGQQYGGIIRMSVEEGKHVLILDQPISLDSNKEVLIKYYKQQ